MSTGFVHLHVHTHYSLLDSTVKVKGLVDRVKALGMSSVAVTDHANLFAAIEFQQQAQKAGVHPILGTQLNVLAETEEGGRSRFNHLVLLATSLPGYYNLLHLVSMASLHRVDRSGRPMTTWEELEAHAKGLVALTGDIGGEVPQALLRREPERAQRVVERLQRIYGEGQVFLEVQRHEGLPETLEACELLVELGQRMRVPLVATNNVHFLHAEDFRAQAALLCIGLNRRVNEEILDQVPLRDLYLKSPEEMWELFEDLPEALHNTVALAERCQVVIPTGTPMLPTYRVPEGETVESYFRQRCIAGLDARLEVLREVGKPFDEAVYRDRLDVEMNVIVQMDFPGYFLIVWDFIAAAKERGIAVGPGRGSGAGSLVAWALEITDIDPIPYGLLFERFLNPERVSMPDFDIDFCQDRRAEVIQYVCEKYGVDQVGQIVTFGQLKAKAVVRDVARVLNLPLAEADRLAKLVPNELNIKLADAIRKEPKLAAAREENPSIRLLLEIGLALEGNHRNTGMHAAGVVIAESELWHHVPVFRGVNGELVTQYAKSEVEDAGLVKFDFLGLKTLTVIQDAVALVNRDRADGDHLDFRKLEMDEAAVYRLISTGETTGVFQMESEGFQRLMRKLQPDCFEDIVAAVALYRPGPLGTGMVDTFIDVKHGRLPAEYPHPLLEDVLRETYGVFVYQEQVMLAARVLAGFTLGGADLLRRAMGKKKEEAMAAERVRFVEGASGRDIPPEKAGEIFDLISHFAGYGFNKSHSAAYAVLTYQTAYLKAFHPCEFYAALMSNDADRTDKVVRYIQDARQRKIAVLPPDINDSIATFGVAGGAIRFGFGAVKGIGSGPIEAIVEAREEGRFTGLSDFCERVDLSRCGKRAIETLIRCGALDSLHPDAQPEEKPTLVVLGARRAQLLAGLDGAVDRGTRARQDRQTGQESLFSLLAASGDDAVDEALPTVPPWNDREVLAFEKKGLGFYVSGHPLDRYEDECRRYADTTTESLRSREDGAEVMVAGVLHGIAVRTLKSGKGQMATGLLEDTVGEVELVVFPRAFEACSEVLESEEPVLVKGTVRWEGDGEEDRRARLVVQDISLLRHRREEQTTRVLVVLEGDGVQPDVVEALRGVLQAHPGETPVGLRLLLAEGRVDVALPEDVRVLAGEDFAFVMESQVPGAQLRYL